MEMMMATTGAPPQHSSHAGSVLLSQRIVSVEELASDWRLFEAFQWATGFGEALHVVSRSASSEEAPTPAAEAQDASGANALGSSAAVPPEKVTLKFKGWDGSSKWSPSHRRRIAKALSGVLPESFRALLAGLSDSHEEEDETPGQRRRSPTVRLEVKDVGLVVAHLDVLIVKESKGKGHPPPHNGLTMMDEVAAVVELCCDEDSMEGEAQRRLFVKTVLSNLLKESPIPVFLTDLMNCAIKATVVRGLRGVPLVVYERLTIDAFTRELHVPKKTTVANKAVAETLRRFKYGWVLPLGRCRIPFGDLGSGGRALKNGSLQSSVSAVQTAETQNNSVELSSGGVSAPVGASVSPGTPAAKKRGRSSNNNAQIKTETETEAKGEGAKKEGASPSTEATAKTGNISKNHKSEALKVNGAVEAGRAVSASAVDSSTDSSSEEEPKAAPPQKRSKKGASLLSTKSTGAEKGSAVSSSPSLGPSSSNRHHHPQTTLSLAPALANHSDNSYDSSDGE